VPPVTGINPNIAFIKVLFPAPLGPIIPVKRPGATTQLTFRSASTVRYCTPTWLILIAVDASSEAAGRWQTIFAQSVSGEKVAVFIGWFYLAFFLDYSNNEKNMKTSIKRNNLKDR
jgi:hypothetical protein